MLRIHFTSQDLGRVRIAPGPHPLWETILSINSLQSPKAPRMYWDWRRQAMTDARKNADHQRLLRAAAVLVPAVGNFPDFLTPAITDPDAEAHYDHMLSLPSRAVRVDLECTFGRNGGPAWARKIHDHGRVDPVVNVLRRYHDTFVRPIWTDAHRRVETERMHHARRLLDDGTEGLLGDLHPSIRWSNPVLTADYPREHGIDLAGRGLVVVPTHFCWGAPVTFIDGDRMPMLVCPGQEAQSPVRTDAEIADRVELLGKLLGGTRARLLSELVVAGSTTELAVRLGISAAAVSQHAKALRAAGLLDTQRFGQSVVHALTDLGHRLTVG